VSLLKLFGMMLLSLGFLVACSPPPPVPDDNYFRISSAVNSVAAESRLRLDGGVYIERPETDGLRRSRHIVYSDDAEHLRLRKYNYQLWEDTPPRLLQRILIEQFKVNSQAEQVSDRPSTQDRFRLRSRLTRFDRLLQADAAKAVVELEFWLESNRSDERQIFNRSYSATVTASDLSMEQTAVAFSKAIAKINQDLFRDLSD